MKKILAALLALLLIGPAVFSQDDEISRATKLSILNDYTTAQRIVPVHIAS
jgi:hypothetical protein